MIDLHIHSKYSADGKEEVSYILSQAEELKLKYISITDHNCCNAYEELKKSEVRSLFSGQIIPGVELSTKLLGIPIEVLGYNINPKIMQKLLDDTYLPLDIRNKIEVERIYKKATQEGIVLPNNFIEAYDGTVYCSKYLHMHLIKDNSNRQYINDNAWNDSMIFYREYMSNPKTLFYVDTDDLLPDFDTVFKMVKDAGGMVFIPHIYEYRENALKILEHILANFKIDGIECYYRNFTSEQTTYLLSICEKSNLFVSGGSDYHGRQRPNIKIGTGEGTLNVPDEIVEKWNK